MESHDDSSSPHPPIHINAETHEFIRSTWIRKCKETACFHKCFLQVYDIIGDYFVEYDASTRERNFYDITFSHPPRISDIDGFEPIRRDFISNLESLIPGYFSELSPSASDKEKFESNYKFLEGFDDRPEPFHRTLARTLSELYLRRLTKTDSLRDLKGGPPALLQLSLKQLLKQLSKSIEEEQATFSCGGSIAIDSSLPRSTGTSGTSHNPRNSPPVTIYWSGDDEQLHKLSLPYENSGNEGPRKFDQLLANCASGKFRPEGSLYNHVGVLDKDRFSTNFHPADFGIIHTIEQLLLPSISQPESQFDFRKIRAELYELNVHSSTTPEVFRHADTPKSRDLFGLLVVCLPSSFEGGQLSICHNEGIVEFDWSRLSASSIQWAAFYSDCEHNTSPILNGHRITLTYKLYVMDPIGGPLIRDPIVDAKSFPLYDMFKVTLQNPAFLRSGGALGPFCSHPYPHTSEAAASGLPKALKGTDMALFTVLQSLGLKAQVVPILDSGRLYSVGNPNLAIPGSAPEGPSKRHYCSQSYDYNPHSDYEEKERFDDFQKTGKMKRSEYNSQNGWQDVETSFYLIYRRLFDDFNGAIDLESYWKILLLVIRPDGLGMPTGSSVGHDLHPYRVYSGADGENDAPDYWNFSFMPGITWLSTPKHELPASTCLQAGHRSTETRYSCLAIIAIVPPAIERELSIY